MRCAARVQGQCVIVCCLMLCAALYEPAPLWRRDSALCCILLRSAGVRAALARGPESLCCVLCRSGARDKAL